MTIHKAKGLEFDTVILPGLDALPRSDEQRLLLWLEHRGELLLAPIAESGSGKDPIYSYLASIERRKSEQETARLLYVAATRARRTLHLLGSIPAKTDGSRAEPEARSFLKLLWPVVREQFGNPIPVAPERTAPRVQTIRRLPASWQVPAPAPEVYWRRAEIGRKHPAEAVFDKVSERARSAGAALHVFLQRMAREGLEVWDEAAVQSARGAYQSVLRNWGVPPGELLWAAERVESGLLRTLRDPRGRWILESHPEAASELAIAGLMEGSLCEVAIDRTFIDETGVRWIIDFKTSTHEGANLENFLEREKERYRDQLERYARLMAGRDAGRPIRLGLYFPLLGEWLEWAAPGILRRQASLFEL
jgi:ATP-dependent exoDNAse (exonuclease V) beta subunit